MDKDQAVAIQKELADHARELARCHGLKLVSNRASYSDTDVSIRIVFEGENEQGENRLIVDWKRQCTWYGLKPEWLNQSFQDNRGETMTIIGLDVKKKKYPVIVECNGRQYKLTTEQVKKRMKAD